MASHSSPLPTTTTTTTTTIRLATIPDIPTLSPLICKSVTASHPAHYTAQQIKTALTEVYIVDPTLLDDGHGFVAEISTTSLSSNSDPSSELLTTAAVAKGDSKKIIVAFGAWTHRDAKDKTRFLDPSTESAKLKACYVDPAFTRRGLGHLVLEACESAARAAGFRTMELKATLPGVSFYEREGYSHAPGDVSYEMSGGLVLELVRMVKQI